jgi:HD superfamily phosphohydrolase YqeK
MGVALPGETAVDRYWGPFILSLVGFLLEVTSRRNPLRGGGGTGSIAFVAYFAALILFGPFWSAVIAGTATLGGQLVSRALVSRVVFNTSQKVLSAFAAGIVYALVGGESPAVFLTAGSAASFDVIVKELGAFFVGSLAYFGTNSYLVSWAVAISNGKSFSDVWRTNTLWVLGYDIGSSALALGVAWLYTIFADGDGFSRLGFPAVFLPVIAVRHVYRQLNELRSMYDKLDESKEELEQNIREALVMMVKSIEARDPYTSGHSRRVAMISEAIAMDFGLSEERVSEVKNAALLHDVGKIHAEFAPLLSKEGKLSPDEWELMKTHASRSAELVGLFSKFNGPVQEAVLHHHERWDGLGYPVGRAGEDIPLGSRIIMIADTIDAMTTDRPYRKALGWDVVVAELNKHKGKQFDPSLVECAVGSVSLRRMISSPGFGNSEFTPESVRPLRSHSSLFSGLRFGEPVART